MADPTRAFRISRSTRLAVVLMPLRSNVADRQPINALNMDIFAIRLATRDAMTCFLRALLTKFHHAANDAATVALASRKTARDVMVRSLRTSYNRHIQPSNANPRLAFVSLSNILRMRCCWRHWYTQAPQAAATR